MIIEIMGSSEFCMYDLFIQLLDNLLFNYCRKAKPADICNFYNNVESIFDHLIRRNKCYRIDSKYENLISAGAEKVCTYTGFTFSL